MPASETAETGRLEEALRGVEALVARLRRQLSEAREKADRETSARARLEESLEGVLEDGMDAEEMQERIRGLAEENRRLKERMTEARERAERIRGRLIVLEDDL